MSVGNTTGVRESTSKVAYLHGGKVGAGCRVGDQLGMSAGGLVSSSHMAAWASSSMAAKVPKERAGSCQSFQSQGPELAHCYFHRVLQDNSVTSPALIQWEE